MMRAERTHADASRLAVICREHRIGRLVIGLPLHSDGRVSEQGEKTVRWAEEVADILNLPVRFIDERYSSARATDRVGRQGGGAGGGEPGPRRRAAYRASIDQAAAVLILEDEADPGLHPATTWTARPDPFSSFRSGFDLRQCDARVPRVAIPDAFGG